MEDFFDFSRLAFADTTHPKTQRIAVDMALSNMPSCIDSMPLAMAYVPIQSFGVVYEPEKALVRGTIFPDLDKPFIGCKRGDAR